MLPSRRINIIEYVLTNIRKQFKVDQFSTRAFIRATTVLR